MFASSFRSIRSSAPTTLSLNRFQSLFQFGTKLFHTNRNTQHQHFPTLSHHHYTIQLQQFKRFQQLQQQQQQYHHLNKSTIIKPLSTTSLSTTTIKSPIYSLSRCVVGSRFFSSTTQASSLPITPTSSQQPLSKQSLYSKVDEQLLRTAAMASSTVKRRLPKGKIFASTLLLLIIYLTIQWGIRKKAAKYVSTNVMNVPKSQILSLQGIASLSREDIFHIFQSMYPDMTNNSMFDAQQITFSAYDEIYDGRDDRKLFYQRYRYIQEYLLHDSQLFYAQEEQTNLKSELDTISTQLQNYFPQLAINPTTLEIISIQEYQFVDPSIQSLESLLQPTEAIKSQLMHEIETVSQEQRSLFSQKELPQNQRQALVSQIQSQLTDLQHQLIAIEAQQHDLRTQHYHQQQQRHQNAYNLPPEQQLLNKYLELLDAHNDLTISIAKFSKSKSHAFDQLTPEQQQHFSNYITKSQPYYEHPSDLYKSTNLEPDLIPVVEELYQNQYFSDDNDDYPISEWTMGALLRNLPSGSAGDSRYIKFHDALTALGVLTKSLWSPSDPHYQFYIKPQLLRDNYLNVQRAFEDYLNDPMCTGGYLELPVIHDTIIDSTSTTSSSQSILPFPYQQPSTIDNILHKLDNIFTIPESILRLVYPSSLQKRHDKFNVLSHYADLHSETLNIALSTDQQIQSIDFSPIYSQSIENRIKVLGHLFERAHEKCDWDKVPYEMKLQIAQRFEHLRLRKLSNFPSKYDNNPKQPLSLAWSSQFAPDPIQDTPQARNQYRRSLGSTPEQYMKIQSTLDVIEKQPLSRLQFEKLIKTMMNAGHFSKYALLTRTNNIWPIEYHLTSPRVIAQAYYDVLGKLTDEPITFDEFHHAAQHWGRIGRYNLWYYAPEKQGFDIPSGSSIINKLKEKSCRFMYTYTGIPTWMSQFISNHVDPQKQMLSLSYLELEDRLQKQVAEDTKTKLLDTFHSRGDLTLAQFSAHSRNIHHDHHDPIPTSKREKKVRASLTTNNNNSDIVVIEEQIVSTLPDGQEISSINTTTTPPTPTTTAPINDDEQKPKEKRSKKRIKKDKTLSSSSSSSLPPTTTLLTDQDPTSSPTAV